jgi:hypothetical protein
VRRPLHQSVLLVSSDSQMSPPGCASTLDPYGREPLAALAETDESRDG